jgi:hypothetical protein
VCIEEWVYMGLDLCESLIKLRLGVINLGIQLRN